MADLNALLPIEVIDVGKFTEVKLLAFSTKPTGTLVILEEDKSKLVRPEFLNALLPTEVKLVALLKSTEVKLLAFSKALLPILVRPLVGKVILVNPVPLKALAGRLVI